MLESGSLVSSSITLAVAAIGAGMLAFPLAFANLGLIAATVALTTIAFFTVVSFYYLALGIERLGLCSYEDLTRVLLGPKYEKAVRIMLVALNFGVAVCYVVVIGEMMQPLQPSIAKFFLGGESAPTTFVGSLAYGLVSTPSRCLCLVWLILMLPLSMTRSMAALRYTTALAICASIYIVTAVVYRQMEPSNVQGQCAVEFKIWNGATDLEGNLHLSTPAVKNRHKISHVLYPSGKAGRMEEGIPPLANSANRLGHSPMSTTTTTTTTVSPRPTANGDSGEAFFTNTIYLFNVHTIMFLALPIIGYSLDCQCFVFQLYCDLKPSIRNAWTMGKVAALSMALACLMYLLVGTFGYLSFGERTRGNILQNYDPTTDWVMGIGYALYSVPVVMAYALTIFPLRDAIFNYYYGVTAAEQSTVISSFSFYSWSFVVSVATLVFGVMTPGIVVIIGLLGAMCSSILCFVLPASFRIQMHERGKLPFGWKGGNSCAVSEDAAEETEDRRGGQRSVVTDNDRQLAEVRKILEKESQQSAAEEPTHKDCDPLQSSSAHGTVGYGSIIIEAQSSSDAELHTVSDVNNGENIRIPLSRGVDSALAHGMLWLGIVSGILGTVAATLNILIGIGG